MSTANISSQGPISPPLAVRWRHWPLRDEFVSHAVPVSVIGLLTVCAAAATHNGWIAAFLLVAWIAVSWPMVWASEYELNASGISQLCAGRIKTVPWRMIRRRREQSGGIFLYTQEQETLFHAGNAIYLPFGSRRQEIVQSVNYYLGQVPVK